MGLQQSLLMVKTVDSDTTVKKLVKKEEVAHAEAASGLTLVLESVCEVMKLSWKLHAYIVLPMLLVSVLVATFTYLGLAKNASFVRDALETRAKTARILSLILTQDAASKALLVNPEYIDTFAGEKIEAYDEHKELLGELESHVKSQQMKKVLTDLKDLDSNKLRPLDTLILETLFDDIDQARSIYFSRFLPEMTTYKELVEELDRLGQDQLKLAQQETAAKNQLSMLYICLTLILGIALVSLTIILLARRVEQSASNMRTLLASLSEGICFFDAQGRVAPERSQALEEILPGSSSAESFEKILAPYAEYNQSSVQTGMGLLWPKDDEGFVSPFSASISMFPKQLSVERDGELRHVALEYRELFNDPGELEKVVVIAIDQTDHLKSLQEAQTQAERVAKISLAASDLQAYRTFMEEAISLFRSIDGHLKENTSLPGDARTESSSKGLFEALKRDVHTLKGVLATFQFTQLSQLVHNLEGKLPGQGEYRDAKDVGKCWERMKDTWKFESADIEKVLGLKHTQHKAWVERAKINSLLELARSLGHSELEDRVLGLQRLPLSEAMRKYQRYLDELTRENPGKRVRLLFESDSCEVSAEEVGMIDGALVHILRNAFDHGIESEERRLAAGKDPIGSISLACYRTKTSALHYVIKDDGAGVEADKLALKAVKLGVWSQEERKAASHAQKVDLIFHSGLSSRDALTNLSGRGVGMDAVKTRVEELGGSLSVHSQPTQGTQIEIDVPTKAFLNNVA